MKAFFWHKTNNDILLWYGSGFYSKEWYETITVETTKGIVESIVWGAEFTLDVETKSVTLD